MCDQTKLHAGWGMVTVMVQGAVSDRERTHSNEPVIGPKPHALPRFFPVGNLPGRSTTADARHSGRRWGGRKLGQGSAMRARERSGQSVNAYIVDFWAGVYIVAG